MGVSHPVGAPMASSHPVLSEIHVSGTNLVLSFWADSERTYSLMATDALGGNAWSRIADTFPAPLPRKVSITNSLPPAGKQAFFRLVTPRIF